MAASSAPRAGGGATLSCCENSVTTTKLPSSIERHLSLRHPGQDQTELVLVRHGRTRANREGRFVGATDVPLDALGRAQARRLAEHIAHSWPADALVSSPLQRALATATEIGRRLAVQPRVVADLQEMDFGRYEGHTFEEIKESDPAFVARLANLADDDVGWPGGERRSVFYARVWNAMAALLHQQPGQRLIVVAHGGVIGAFLAMLRGQNPSDPAIYALRNCSLSRLIVKSAYTEIHCCNDVAHLDGLEEGVLDEEDGSCD